MAYKRVKLTDTGNIPKAKVVVLALLAAAPVMYDWAEGKISTPAMLYRIAMIAGPTILTLT